MPENGMPGPVCDLSSVRESVCIHTRKIFDSCRDKDCVEDLRFYPTASAMELLSGCQMVRGGTAELLYVYTDVEPVTFNRGFYSVDMRFYYRVTLQVCTGTPRYTEVEGLGAPGPRACACSTSAASCSAARAAPRSFPPTRSLTSWISPAVCVPTCPPPWWRPWTPSFWTPGWTTAASPGAVSAA